MEINIDPKEIEKAISQAVLDSSLGDVVKEEVQKAVDSVKKGRYGSQSPIRVAVEAEIQRIVVKVLRDEYGDQVRQAVREMLTDEVVARVVAAAIDAVHERL